ncbi:MAG: DUF554 domain-containing protein [Mucinivorans sp.]
MVGTLINAAAILVGATLGILLGSRLNERYSQIVTWAIGLMTVVLGLQMALGVHSILFVVVSLVIGSLLGELLRLDQLLDRGADFLRRFVPSRGAAADRFSEGFVTSTLLFCVGTMAILGPIQDASGAEPTILYTKSMMDGTSAMFFAATLGIGVLFSAIPLLIYQGSIGLAAGFLMSFLGENSMADFTATGGILLLGLGISILKLGRIDVVNMLPSLVVVVVLNLLW